MDNFERIANRTRTQAILEQHGFNFKKSLGQNFLADTHILEKIAEAAHLSDSCNVLEIGPGIGSLTQVLLEQAHQVLALEIDKTLIPILKETLASYDNLLLRNADILQIDLKEAVENFETPNLPLKVVANLPYYITTPIIMRLMESKLPFTEMIIMMQKEVADRITAAPSTKSYGSLSIAVRYFMETVIAFTVPRTVFVPAPNVDSAILRLTQRERPLIAVKDEAWFFRVVKLAFIHRRKTLMNNLLSAFGKEYREEITHLLFLAEIDPGVRAEALTIAEFGRLADGLLPLKEA